MRPFFGLFPIYCAKVRFKKNPPTLFTELPPRFSLTSAISVPCSCAARWRAARGGRTRAEVTRGSSRLPRTGSCNRPTWTCVSSPTCCCHARCACGDIAVFFAFPFRRGGLSLVPWLSPSKKARERRQSTTTPGHLATRSRRARDACGRL